MNMGMAPAAHRNEIDRVGGVTRMSGALATVMPTHRWRAAQLAWVLGCRVGATVGGPGVGAFTARFQGGAFHRFR